MLTPNIRSKLKNIKIQTRRIMQSNISGDYHSAFKGSGLEFDQLREYQFGDDVRFIDWNSSAKMNKLMIKQFVEERDRTIILAIDVSASSLYSSQQELRRDMVAQVAAALAFIAHENKDKVGALFFTDQTERWFPPKRSTTHIGSILETIFTLEPDGEKTDIASALKFLIQLKKRNAVIFLLSDWIDDITRYEKLLTVIGRTNDFVGLRFIDHCEQKLPDVGLLDIQDPETGLRTVINTRQQKKLHHDLITRLLAQKKLFEKRRLDLLDLMVGQPFISPLVSFFHKRIRRQI